MLTTTSVPGVFGLLVVLCIVIPGLIAFALLLAGRYIDPNRRIRSAHSWVDAKVADNERIAAANRARRGQGGYVHSGWLKQFLVIARLLRWVSTVAAVCVLVFMALDLGTAAGVRAYGDALTALPEPVFARDDSDEVLNDLTDELELVVRADADAAATRFGLLGGLALLLWCAVDVLESRVVKAKARELLEDEGYVPTTSEAGMGVDMQYGWVNDDGR